MAAARPRSKKSAKPLSALAALSKYAATFPEAYEDHPWGETVYKVKGKVFVFLGKGESGFGMSAKLPRSAMLALDLPFAKPTGYGLGKSGWVTAQFGAKDKPPLDILRRWIEESYRAVAPKKLVARIDQTPRSA